MKRFITEKASLLTIGTLALSVPGENGTPIQIQAPSGIPTGNLSTDGTSLIGLIISILLISTVLFALGFIVWGGIMWTTSGGDKQKVASARKIITFSVIGLFVAFLAFFIIGILGSFFNLQLIGGLGSAKSVQPIPPSP